MRSKEMQFYIEWDGLDEMIQQLDEIEKDIDRIALDEMNQYALLVEEGARALAHHKEGDLEGSISAARAERTGVNSYQTSVGTNIEYAVIRHEEPGRGLGTRSKPTWRGYMPGMKYLENAVKATAKEYDEMNARILSRLMGE